MPDEDTYRYEFEADSREALRQLLLGAKVDFGCRPVVKQEGERYSVTVYATETQIRALQSARRTTGVTIRRGVNETQQGIERQREVSRVNRFSRRGSGPPRGLGAKIKDR